MAYRILFTPRAARDLRGLATDVQVRIGRDIDALGDQPRPQGCKKLKGEGGFWRIRIGDYRVVYQIRDRALVVVVITIGHRREVYR